MEIKNSFLGVNKQNSFSQHLIAVLFILFVIQVPTVFSQVWYVTELTCSHIGCRDQQVNVTAQVNFQVTFSGFVAGANYIDIPGRGYVWTDAECPDFVSVQNNAELQNDFFWVGYYHRSVELVNFNPIFITLQPGTFKVNLLGIPTYTPADTQYFPELCPRPLPGGIAGGCNGLPDYGQYPSGCASGFIYSGGVCTRSTSFISNCNNFGGYDNSSCGCFGVCTYEGSCSPVLIDVSGNGFALTNAVNGVNFDVDGDGIPERRAWTNLSSDDSWLVLDRNRNGTIDGGRELFGSATSQPPPPAGVEFNGFNALAEYDKDGFGGNADGWIDNQDTIFNSLLLWQDTNHNGISEASELKTLSSLGVVKIDLDYKESKRTDEFGNQFKYRAKVKDAQGNQVGRWAWDVFLVTQP